MKKQFSILVLAAAAAVTAQAAPFMAVGDGAELFATGKLDLRGDDNILLASDANGKTADTIFEVVPGLELDFGKNSQLQGSLTLEDELTYFTTHHKYNTNLFQGDFVSKYDDGKMKLDLNAGYHELNQNTVDVRGLIRRNVGTLGGSGEVIVSEKTAIGAGLNFKHEDYHPQNYVDSDTTSVPLNFYYKYTPKVDLSLGYTYRDYTAKNGLAPDSTDHFFNIGARGEFTPKLTGKFAIGYTRRNFSAGKINSADLLGLDTSLAYELTPKSTVQLGATNDFGTSPQGEQQKNFTVNVLGTTKITEEFSVNAGLSYRSINYYNTAHPHTDDYWEATVGAAYVVNANLRLVGAYVYRSFASNVSGSDFTNNVLSFSANIRY